MTKQPIDRYFAAANGYSGFRSYFTQIFERKKFERVYIIKGGPGTGKSTLMKKILREFENSAYSEKIFCSSDPNSLDGIIIEKNEKRIAVIDGTSPHEEDARIPGAVDEIINLGEAWNENALEKAREKILKLTENKKASYNTAYGYLEIAGLAFKKKTELTKKAYTGNDECAIIDLVSNNCMKSQGRSAKVKLVSSFSKNGYERIDTGVKDVFSVVGTHGSEYVFMNDLSNYIASWNFDHTLIPSPYSDNITEGIYLTDADRLIICGGSRGRIIDTSRFIDDNVIKGYAEAFTLLEGIEDQMLEAAKNELRKASEYHFETEKIYSASMDFDMHDRICASIINEIKIKFR